MPCRPGISSMSLGHGRFGHSFEHKMQMAAKYKMKGIEIFYADLVDHAKSESPSDLLAAAASIRHICDSLHLEIISLQPFMHYEGLKDRKRHAERIDEIKFWIELTKLLGTDIVAIPSSFLSRDQISSDINLIVNDLQEVADLGLQQSPVIRFAYESLCWGTYVDKWEKCWDIVQRVDRPNFGICLDTFNILGKIYADPTSRSRKTPQAEKVVRDSIQRLVEQLKPHREKIFFVQVVDAEDLEQPLTPTHPFYDAEQPARMSWSRNCRLFYGETEYGAYLPVKDIMQAIVHDIGFDGWISAELFNQVMNSKEPHIPQHLAERAAISWQRLSNDLHLDASLEDSNPCRRRHDSLSALRESPTARL